MEEVEVLYRVKELSEIMGVSKSSIYRHMREGKLGSLKVGGSRLVSRSQAIDFLRECAEASEWK